MKKINSLVRESEPVMIKMSDTNLSSNINIKDVKRRDGTNKIVGTIEFKDTDCVEEACGEGKVNIEGQSYNLYFAKSQSNKEKVIISDKKVYIKGLPKDIEESELADMLGKCKISTTSSGSHIVFAEFDTPEEQKTALDKLEKMEFNGRRVKARKALEKVYTLKPKGRKDKSGTY